MIEIIFSIKLPSNVDIFSKLVTEIQGLLHRYFWYWQEGVDLVGFLTAPQFLQWDLNPGDELSREVPGGGGVDEVPLLGVDLSTAGLLSQFSFRHRPSEFS